MSAGFDEGFVLNIIDGLVTFFDLYHSRLLFLGFGVTFICCSEAGVAR